MNNLDLVLEVNGQRYSSMSIRDNVEQIDLGRTVEGTIKVYVVGTKIPVSRGGRLPFALVIR